MKNIFLNLFVLYLIFFNSCKNKNSVYDKFQYKTGVFEIPATDKYSKTTIIRKDSLQIEHYENRIDTLLIRWENNFKYSLKMTNPKTEIDKKIVYVKITSIKENSYDFTAKVGVSNFEQKGTIYKK